MTELFRGVFDLPTDPAEEVIALRALNRVTFPWEWLLPGMAKRKPAPVKSIRIRFRTPVLGPEFSGSFSPDAGLIAVNPVLLPRPRKAMRNIVHELGHCINAFWLTEPRMDQLHRLFHDEPYEPWFGKRTTTVASELGDADEGFACGVGLALANGLDVSFAAFTHVLRPADYDRFRAIVLRPKASTEPPPPPVTPDPLPTPMPPPDPLDSVREHLETAIGELEAALADLAPKEPV